MCGIFSVVAIPKSGIEVSVLKNVLTEMFKLSATRGKDASGVLSISKDEINVFKLPEPAHRLLKTEQFSEVLNAAVAQYQQGSEFVVAGHTRMVTNGSEDNENNNQPVIKDEHLILHNGIIVNDAELWKANPHWHREYDVDTEIFAAILAESRKKGNSFPEAMISAFSSTRGANTVTAIGAKDDSLLLGTMNGSMYYLTDKTATLTLVSSERVILEQIIRFFPYNSLDKENIVHLKPKQYSCINLNTSKIQSFNMVQSGIVSYPTIQEMNKSRRITVLKASISDKKSRFIQLDNDWKTIENLMVTHTDALSSLRRCTKCVLPETFPFIRFNAGGLCQFCSNHQPQQLKDVKELYQIVEKIRKPSGEPDCLVPLSGGRDSCYGLHYLKKVCGFNPVSYTYDWGFVTDLARRNISRMCEQLEVEHILVAADIRKKRENVRKNVLAWLKKPEMGMIPLFMAGDKMFLYYDRVIRKQMNLGPIFFSTNWLEKTGFKTGFAGVDETAKHESHHQLTSWNKLKLLSYYASKLITNPGYLNTSITDTLAGSAVYYLRAQDYYHLFDYIPWIQSDVEQTLIGQYDWEIAPDSHSTWRIGDGTAPFYNYIYQTVGGFSEHDTFRSNQIREGLISRKEALELIKKENLPRVESFKWYCDVIGIDAVKTLKIINAIPKRYNL